MERDCELLSRIDLDKLADVTTLQDKLMAVQAGLPNIQFSPIEYINEEIAEVTVPGEIGGLFALVGGEEGIRYSDTSVDLPYGSAYDADRHKIEISEGYDEITHNDQDGNEQKFKTHLVKNTNYDDSGEIEDTTYFVALRSEKGYTMWLDFAHVGGVHFSRDRLESIFVMPKPEAQDPRATFLDGNVGLALEARHYKEVSEIKEEESCPDLELMVDELLRAIEELKPKN